MTDFFSVMIAPLMVGFLLLIVEYMYFVPNSQSSDKTEKTKILLGVGVFLVLGVAFIYGLYKLWDVFSVFIVYAFVFITTIGSGLYLHNVFYRATFLRLKYYQQYFSENYGEAAKTLQDIAQARPHDLNPLLEQASIYLEKTRDYKSAVDILEQILAKGGDNFDILDNLRIAYWNLGESTEDELILYNLIITIERMLAIKPTDPDLLLQLSAINFYLEDYKTGVEKINILSNNLLETAERAKIQSPENSKITFTKVVDNQSKIISMLGEILLETRKK